MKSSKPKNGFSMSLSKGKPPNAKGQRSDSGNTKRSAIGDTHGEDDDASAAPRKDFVTGIGGGKVVTREITVDRGPRVIALATNPWERAAAEAAAAAADRAKASSSFARPANGISSAAATRALPPGEQAEKSLDQLAAEAIAREYRGENRGSAGGATDRPGLGLASDRVISMATAKPSGGAAGADDGRIGHGEGTAAREVGEQNAVNGILTQNGIPGLAEIDGENEKFKHDLGHRAEDVSVRSKAYVDVPVNEFGAALLRGMGWKGTEGGTAAEEGSMKDVEPRHHRLGLGAQPKPPEEMKRPRKRKPGEKPRAGEENLRKMWEQKAKEEAARSARPSAAQLSVMAVVDIATGSMNGRRAMVLKTQGVAGLNKISVRLEDGEEIVVDKSAVIQVSEDDLAKRPFSVRKKKKSSRTEGDGKDAVSKASGKGGDGDAGRGGREGDRNERSVKRSRSPRFERDGQKDGKRAKKDKKKKEKRLKREQRDGRASSPSSSSGGDDDGRKSNAYRRRENWGRDDAAPDRKRHRDRDRNGNLHGDRDRNVDRDRDRGRDGNRDRDRDRDGNRDRDYRIEVAGEADGRASVTTNNASNGSDRSGADDRARKKNESSSWLRPHIRVRVVHKSYAEGKAYLGKGRVVDVLRVGEASVRMDLGNLLVEGVNERHLETVLPARGGKVVVVRGAEKGVTGKLLAKDREKETALVQVYEDLRAVRLSLDDVAEFTGALDDDLGDVGY